MKRLMVDSSVILSSLLENEMRHKEALKIWNSVLSGKNVAIIPYSLFVEVVAAVRRRTGSEELAREVGNGCACAPSCTGFRYRADELCCSFCFT